MAADPPSPDPAPVDLTPTLVANLRGGDTGAADLLDKLYRERLVCFCHGYLDSRDEAEDVVHDVFCRVIESKTVPENFRAWIYKVSRDRCLALQRSRGRPRDAETRPSGSDLDDQLTGHLTGEASGERWERLRRIVEELPADQREVLHLRYAEGLSRADIAEVLELDEGAVKSRLYHAMEKLRFHDSLAEGP
jgi:RNA polymerase sigma-70 factor (ECF subfamily)